MRKLISLSPVILALVICFTSCKDTAEREETIKEIDRIGAEETGQDEIAYSEFSQYDSNRDGSYDQSEFGKTYENQFTNMDKDSDGSLNKEEFYASTFDIINKDHDNSITEQEWNRGKENILNERVGEKEYSEFDINADGQISLEEWENGFKETGWFTSYDSNKDKLMQPEEYDKGFFDDWDLDDDGSVSEEEFSNFSPTNEGEVESPQSNQQH